MTALSSAGWVVHDVGLAAAIGGPLFEFAAMAPALEQSTMIQERDRISLDAAQRFSWVKLLSHASFAVPWLIGRTMRSGREVSAKAEALTKAKDILVGVSLVSGVIGLLGIRRVRSRIQDGGVVQPMGDMQHGQMQQGEIEEHRIPTKSGGLGFLGMINVLSNIGILGVTALLAMEGSKSVRFSASSRNLP
jgi:hypothetical protein